MKVFRLTCCRLARVFLVSALMSSTLVTSAVGEALVLHQHGARHAHLHVLGYGDLLSNAAESSRFGHCSRPEPALRSASQRVRPLAIVTTGSVFVSTPRSTGIDEAGLVSPHHGPPVSMAASQGPQAVDSLVLLYPARAIRGASADILLRNHTLLL